MQGFLHGIKHNTASFEAYLPDVDELFKRNEDKIERRKKKSHYRYICPMSLNFDRLWVMEKADNVVYYLPISMV